MRTFCLLLILVNALFFAWSQFIGGHTSPLDRAASSSATPPARIVLAREVAAASEAEDEKEIDPAAIRDVVPPSVEPLIARAAPDAAPTPDSLSCSSVGPFADLPQSTQAQAALRTAGYEPRQRLEEGELWVGYWVSVQHFTNRDAAEAAVKMLSDNGMTDVYLMPGAENQHILSLGVFSDYQRAQRRADEVRALGLDALINDRKRAGSVYWLDVDLQAPGQALDTSVFQTGEARIMRLEIRACPPNANA